MKNKVSIENFFDQHGIPDFQKEQFNVYRREEFACHTTFLKNNRRDFYKITLIIRGEGILSTASTGIHIKGNVLTFMNPMIPYSWEPISEEQTGYFCLFTDEFINGLLTNKTLVHNPLFEVGSNQIFQLTEEQTCYLTSIFENMLHETNSEYSHKYDLLRSYVQIILHEALKMAPPKSFFKLSNSSERLTLLFNELMNQQYRIDFPYQQIALKTANDYAKQLMVHVNHLNKILKETSGQNTTSLIANRAAIEARSLLLSTNWDISEIAYCLGFEHVANFNRFFKKHFNISPKEYRSVNFLDKQLIE
ncbi:AraC family transcriptional regulator [Chryseobacterium sp. T20]|uniref:AraC family transcriptional regulator n=1 Tax=Chryseobacterium sp. T20 TaxID=3395375 RepID=UPI0039BD866A